MEILIKFRIVEKENEFAVHGVFSDLTSAEKHLNDVIPVYVERGYFSDKTLTKNSFKIIEGV